MDRTAPLPDLASMAAVFDRLRADPPAVHVITSPVAAERTANTLLALGIRPSLTVNPGEVAAFVAATDALLINLGMLDSMRDMAITVATAEAMRLNRPWVLDPVFAEVSPSRCQRTRDLLALGPAVLKANGREAALADDAPAGTLRIITGSQDQLMLGAHRLIVSNGHPLAGRVTAIGCALGAFGGGWLGDKLGRKRIYPAAVTAYGIAIEQAAARSAGPGSFSTALYDCLAALDGDTILRKGRIA